MTKSIHEIYFNKQEFTNLKVKEFQKSIDNFLADKDEGLYTKALSKTFQKLEPFLKDRFIKMNKDYCFDKTISACWIGLCKSDDVVDDNVEAMVTKGELDFINNKHYITFESSEKLENILIGLKELYINDHVDIPTKEELKTLTNLSNTPFNLDLGNNPQYPSSSILYKYAFDNQWKIKATRLNNVSDIDIGKGHIHPIYRLSKENSKEATNKEIFKMFVSHKLTPIDFKNELYTLLLELDNLSIDKLSSNIHKLDKFIDIDPFIENFKKQDKVRANLTEYNQKMFIDVNKGSWEVYARSKSRNKDDIKITLDTPLVARNPQADIVDGIIGIDFGTKSTVVVHSKESETILPMRVGVGDLSKKEQSHHFENPTVMEFINLSEFLKAYKSTAFRPYTKWRDLTISHTAYDSLKDSNADVFNAYLTELKQWAGDKKRKLKVTDKKNAKSYELKPFLELKEDDFNPIELYAYYLGLYINNQFNGIYLDYILSFPVTYEMQVREAILKSFRKGLSKSLPDIGNKIKDLQVKSGVSEPAAYAAIALQNYGFDEKEKSFYTIFDFGGGTTDFDFGIFRYADEEDSKEERYDYVIEHFGAGGEKYLGGENLLELLAFEVFKKNKELLLKEQISFVLPPECKAFIGSELLLSDSKEAKINMVNLIGVLRKFWERESFKESIFKQDISVDLYSTNGERISQCKLQIKEEELTTILKGRIKRGVDGFFESLREVFVNHADEIDLTANEVNIFLAGNSSKSPLVKELFDARIKQEQESMEQSNYKASFKLFAPLENKDNFEKPNGKTGVAFGLIETRPTGKILVVDKNLKQKEIKFKYYLGGNKRKKFKTILSRETPYNQWKRFIDARVKEFEVYYTSSSIATTNTLPIDDSSVKRKKLKITKIDESKSVYIKLVSPTRFEYGVGVDEKSVQEVVQVELN